MIFVAGLIALAVVLAVGVVFIAVSGESEEGRRG